MVNETKQRFVVATSMMLVASLMLGTVTYAWFTLSTNPEVSALKMNMVANQNLEIALDNGYIDSKAADEASNNEAAGGVGGSTSKNWYTWGNSIDLSYATSDAGLGGSGYKPVFIPVRYNNDFVKAGAGETVENGLADSDGYKLVSGKRVPVESNIYNKFEYAKYGKDGRISDMDTLTNRIAMATKDTDDTPIPANGGLRAYTQGNTTDVNAYTMAFWVRSNEETTLSVANTAKRLADDTKWVDADDDGIVDEGEVTGGAEGTVGEVMGNGTYMKVKVPGNDISRTLNYLQYMTVKLEEAKPDFTYTDTNGNSKMDEDERASAVLNGAKSFEDAKEMFLVYDEDRIQIFKEDGTLINDSTKETFNANFFENNGTLKKIGGEGANKDKYVIEVDVVDEATPENNYSAKDTYYIINFPLETSSLTTVNANADWKVDSHYGDPDKTTTAYKTARAQYFGGKDQEIALEANVAKMLIASLYLDGATITNANALLCDINDMEFNIQFESSAIRAGDHDGGAMTSSNSDYVEAP